MIAIFFWELRYNVCQTFLANVRLGDTVQTLQYNLWSVFLTWVTGNLKLRLYKFLFLILKEHLEIKKSLKKWKLYSSKSHHLNTNIAFIKILMYTRRLFLYEIILYNDFVIPIFPLNIPKWECSQDCILSIHIIF